MYKWDQITAAVEVTDDNTDVWPFMLLISRIGFWVLVLLSLWLLLLWRLFWILFLFFDLSNCDNDFEVNVEEILPFHVAGNQIKYNTTRGKNENITTQEDHQRAVTRDSESNLIDRENN